MLKLIIEDKTIDDVWVVEKTFSIGSADDNSLIINHPSISQQHARIVKQGNDYLLRDLSAANNTYINNKPVTQQKISHSDKILLGEVTIKVIDPKLQNAPQPWSLVACSSWLSGQEFPIKAKDPESESIKVGRGSHCDIILPGTHLSREHAEIVIAGDQLKVIDLNSANGTFINDERVTEGVLRSGDKLRLDVYGFYVIGPGIGSGVDKTFDENTKLRPPKPNIADAIMQTGKPKQWKTRPTSPGNRQEPRPSKAYTSLTVIIASLLLVSAIGFLIYLFA